MSKFDAAVSVSELTLDAWIGSLFARGDLPNGILSGSKSVELEGVEDTVSWNVQQAPTVSLAAPSADQWKRAYKAAGDILQPTDEAFVVDIPKLAVSRRKAGGGQPSDAVAQSGVIAVSAIVVVVADGARLKLEPQAVIIDLSGAKALDRIIYSKVIIPDVLAMVQKLLPTVALPRPSLAAGATLGVPLISVADGRLAAIAKRADAGAPDASGFADLPDSPLVVLLGADLVQSVLDGKLGSVIGQTKEKSGSKDFTVGTARYDASVKIDSLRATPRLDDAVMIAAQAAFTLSVSAGVSVGCPVKAALSHL